MLAIADIAAEASAGSVSACPVPGHPRACHIEGMTAKDRWTVTVRCPKCAGWGTAHLWQEDGWSSSNGDQGTHIESVPYGFGSRRADGRINFDCIKCGVEATAK